MKKNLLDCMMKACLSVATLLIVSTSYAQDAPANPNATVEARNVLNFLNSIKGTKVISGQHDFSPEPTRTYNYVQSITGKYPALWGGDFHCNAKWVPLRPGLVTTAKNMWANNSLVTLMWHAAKPTDQEPVPDATAWTNSVQGTLTTQQWTDLFIAGTAVNNGWKTHVDNIAVYLKQLQTANVPVLWRPYHEMDGQYFWWSKNSNSTQYKRLWIMLYDRLTNYHNLNNLLWVWASDPSSNGSYYPGSAYVDVLGNDIYNGSYSGHSLLPAIASGKPIAITEVGDIPTPQQLNSYPNFRFFMVWQDFITSHNTVAEVQATYNDSRVLTRDEMPNLKAGSGGTTYTVDNTSAGFSVSGTWTPSTGLAGYYGSNYLHDGDNVANASTEYATWTSPITTTGNYDVYMRWTAEADRPDAAPIEINYNGAVMGGSGGTLKVNQTLNGGTWVKVASSLSFTGNSGDYVRIFATDAGYTIADAVRWVPAGGAVGSVNASRVALSETAFETESINTSLQVYPNPAPESVNLRFASEVSGKAFIEIYSALGQKVVSTSQSASAGTNTIKVDLSTITNNGVYYIKVISGSKVMNQTLMVTR